MLLTSSTRRPARLNIQHQERHTVSINETTSAKYAQNKDKNSVIMRSINIPSATSDARRQAGTISAHPMSKMALLSLPATSVSAAKPRIANVILEIGTTVRQEKNNTPPIPANLFPTTNNNITLETMPILAAGPETRVSTNAKPEQKQIERQIQQQKQIKKQIQQQMQMHDNQFASPRTPILEHSNTGVILVTTEKPPSPDKIINSVPSPVSVEQWKPSWLR